MGKSAIFIIAYGLLAAAANFLGGLLVSSRRLGQSTLRYLIALGAGFMLATVFLKMVPESIELWAGDKPTSEAMIIPMMWVLGGYLLIQLVEHTVAPHFHFGEETHEEAMLAEHAALAGVSALMVHTFFDGVSIAAASLVDFRHGGAGLHSRSAAQAAGRLYGGLHDAGGRPQPSRGARGGAAGRAGDACRGGPRRFVRQYGRLFAQPLITRSAAFGGRDALCCRVRLDTRSQHARRGHQDFLDGLWRCRPALPHRIDFREPRKHGSLTRLYFWPRSVIIKE